MITQSDRNETYRDGLLVDAVDVVTDITAQVVEYDLHDKARTLLASFTAPDGLIDTQRAVRDQAIADIATQTAARDAAQAIIDNPASTTAQKNAARTDREFALVRLEAARAARTQANTTLDLIRGQAQVIRLLIAGDLLVENTDT